MLKCCSVESCPSTVLLQVRPARRESEICVFHRAVLARGNVFFFCQKFVWKTIDLIDRAPGNHSRACDPIRAHGPNCHTHCKFLLTCVPNEKQTTLQLLTCKALNCWRKGYKKQIWFPLLFCWRSKSTSHFLETKELDTGRVSPFGQRKKSWRSSLQAAESAEHK